MRPRRHRATLAACLASVLATLAAVPQARASAPAASSCLPHIAQAERHYALPEGLLLAIAMTESGHQGAPYPWALNIGGTPYFPADYQRAARLVRTDHGAPRRDVAIGCMQIHMTYHLDAFGAPEWALHPVYNVWYAAGFLHDLAVRHQSWVSAIGRYHASNPSAQRDYICRVANYLRQTGPRTLAGLGLQDCRSVPVAGTTAAARRDAARRYSADMTAARRVGRIIVLGNNRFGQ